MSDIAYRIVTQLRQLGDVNVPSPSNGQVLTYDSGTSKWVNATPTVGTVTSVALSAPAIFSVSGSPVTSSGTLTLSLASQNANLFWAGPATGSPAAPTFRAIAAADLPTGAGGPYFVLAGVAGGQTGYGGTGSGENATFYSTTHGTKGQVKFGTTAAWDETVGGFTLGTQTAVSNTRLTIATGSDSYTGVNLRPNSASQTGSLLKVQTFDGTTTLLDAKQVTEANLTDFTVGTTYRTTRSGVDANYMESAFREFDTGSGYGNALTYRWYDPSNTLNSITQFTDPYWSYFAFLSASNSYYLTFGMQGAPDGYAEFQYNQNGSAGDLSYVDSLQNWAFGGTNRSYTDSFVTGSAFYVYQYTPGYLSGESRYRLSINSSGHVGMSTPASPSYRLHVSQKVAATGTVTTVEGTDVLSTGTAAAGFGQEHLFRAHSSTGTTREVGSQQWLWATATDASRKGRYVLNVYDTAVKEGFRVESDGTYALISLSGATPTAKLFSGGLSAPASVGTATGTNATAEVSITGGTGGNTTIATTGTGGVGGTISFTCGTGGQAASAVTSSTGGAGGAMTLTAGTGGSASAGATSTGGNGGAVTISAGTAGSGTTAGGTGGTAIFQGGQAAAVAGSAGGAAQLLGRAGSSTGSGGAGGAVTVSGGAAGGDNTVSRVGGGVTILGAASKGDSVGGSISLIGGTGGLGTGTAGAAGGAINLTGGTGGVGSATGGNGANVALAGGTAAAAAGAAGGAITLTAAAGSSTGSGGAGGAVAITCGNAGGDNTVNRAGGAITITAGTSRGGSTGGGITLTAGTGGPGTGTAGAAGGAVTIVAGTGGTGSSTHGTSGAVTVRGGTPPAVANAPAGGLVTCIGGTASTTGAGGPGGAVAITGSNAGGDNTANQAGGAVTITAGTSKGSSAGGAINMIAGAGGPGTGTTGATGGAINIRAGLGGDGSVTDGAGGAIVFQTADTLTLVTRLTIAATGAATYTGGTVTTQTAFTINTGADSNSGLAITGNSGTQSGNLLTLNQSGTTAVMTVAPSGVTTHNVRDAATNASTTGLTLDHFSSGTPAAGFGSTVQFQLQSNTTASRLAGSIVTTWATATDASRASRTVFNANDSGGTRECLRLEASGSAAMIGFLGASASARTSAYTVTNGTTDRSYDANATTVDELADVLYTLITDLQTFGLLG